MTTWDDGVAALSRQTPSSGQDSTSWHPGLRRVPIVITGSPGAGKTEVWRRLTGRNAPDAPSWRVDEGYFFPSSPFAKRRSRIAITTIPGQTSKERYKDLAFYFSARAKLSGVIFVASFGFDRIWANDADVVANELDSMTIETLSERNIDRELSSFRETCEELRRRNLADRRLPSPWLLVIVSKADLFFSGIHQAQRYYLPRPAGGDSPFVEEAERLRFDLGGGAQFRYAVLPAALRTGDYVFSSSRGMIQVASQLDVGHANSSVRLIAETIEELSYA